MKRFALTGFLVVFSIVLFAQNKLLSPKDFLGYEPGDRFTSHYQTVAYFRHIAEVLPNAALSSYGETYEHRPLVYFVISSPENFARLEEIRLNNLRRAGLQNGTPSQDNIAIVWLSYNVHGNEASSMEAAMETVYALADPTNEKTREWLKNTIVIMDPCVNPDGRDRYANFYSQYGNQPPNPGQDGFEHQEPWPGGRFNHYLFDLNRDWAWATQTESHHRLKIYHEWLPHVHVDFHEQGHNNPYYFAPAAEPLHEVISDWQRELQLMIGKNNARYFDQHGWLYFTKEIFDLYYPSYGDTYPTYSGAVGMTYEQAGGGISGLTITTETGAELTLKDRILHHHTSALSTIEVTSQNAERITEEFQKYFTENNQNPASRYKSYLIKASNPADQLSRLTKWLDLHAIRYGHPASTKTLRGFNYQTQTAGSTTASPADIVIDVYQPKSRFITTVFEPTSSLSDSLTYDITAWNLMYAYNLEAYALTQRLPVAKPRQPAPPVPPKFEKPYAFIFRYQSVDDGRFLASLMQNGLKVRCAQRAFRVNGDSFQPGTLIITRTNNHDVSNLDKIVLSLAAEHQRDVFTANSGFVDYGKDLGSGNLRFLQAPRVAMLFADETSPLSAGEIWHFFEQEIHYPVTQIGTRSFKKVNLKAYDVLIVPEGSYTLFEDAQLENIASWVNSGGRLILVGSALKHFVDTKTFSLKKYNTDIEKAEAELEENERLQNDSFPRYEEVERKQLSHNISGAIYKVRLDNSHPLGFGMRDTYYTLKTHERRFATLNNGWNVAYFGNMVSPVQGFAGFQANEALNNSLLLGVEQKGEGEVIYFVDNPLFRSFWENGKMLFANAVFLVGE